MKTKAADYEKCVTIEADHELKGLKRYITFAQTWYENGVVNEKYMYLLPPERVMEAIEKGGRYHTGDSAR